MVDTRHLDGYVEEECASHVPLGVEDAVAVTGFQFCGHRTVALVDFDLLFAVDISQDVVPGNRVTAMHELILLDIVVGDVYRFLLIEFLRDGEEIILCGFVVGCSVLFPVTEERH